MKKLASVLLVLVMLFSLASCGGSGGSSSAEVVSDAPPEVSSAPEETPPAAEEPPEDPKVTLTYAEVNPEASLMGMTAKAFKDKVEELTGGSVTVNVQYGGVLGAEGDVLDTMIGGGDTVDLARISAFSLTSYGTKRSSLLSVPFTFADREHFWKFAKSDLAPQFLIEPHDIGLGVRGLFYAEEGFRHFFFRSEISGIADLAGKKIRVSTDPIMTGMVEGLKASPTVVSFNELYTSLSSGVVDGAEQPIANYQSNSFNEVAPYMILDAHTLGAAQVIMTDSAWDRLSAAQQDAIVEAGKYASDFNAGKSAEIENICIEELKAAGAIFVEVPDKQEWKDACADVIAQSIAGQEDDYNTILGLA
ncbi:MAG: TRAP transporter substrate-binding protein [Oscillospiraceae bacterium]|jgi:TRAP-type C4-dicarboxylate transport system substrate-binding protein|nr:TRAP transporter substrate-binding protein [Oscillospiraceae bacterium]